MNNFFNILSIFQLLQPASGSETFYKHPQTTRLPGPRGHARRPGFMRDLSLQIPACEKFIYFSTQPLVNPFYFSTSNDNVLFNNALTAFLVQNNIYFNS
jgi:hypothetical protein